MTQHLGKYIKNNPIKWPNKLNPEIGLKKALKNFNFRKKTISPIIFFYFSFILNYH